ncbi:MULTISPECIES: FG-GAP repeat domain-containing protein [unclassified Phaeobacter]|uniref:FG-GAP repeat domain-containing protein n=1 Tax=unclassified Phaeobacter TaxID=2621772 RepID=UPI003A866E54
MRLGPQARRHLWRAWPLSRRRAGQALRPWRAGSWAGPAIPGALARAICAGGLLSAMVSAAAAQDPLRLTSAEFAAPTAHYPHGVLGDHIEYSALVVQDSRGTRHRVALPVAGAVFEDLAPRLWDVTGDALPEVVVVESDPDRGAQLAIYGLHDGALRKMAATPHIGTRFRWLAPIAAADLDGDGHIEIAYIDRPHLAKTLRIWRYRDGALHQVAQRSGLTNHRIGEGFITSGLRDCGDGPQLLTVDAGWSRIMVSTLVAGRVISREIGAYSPATGLAAALRCEGPVQAD